MKNHHIASTLLTLLVLAAAPAYADEALAKAKNCMACHADERKLIGPGFQAIKSKYQEDAGAAEKLARKVRAGGVGVWGRVPMPANPQVSDEEALALVKWILGR